MTVVRSGGFAPIGTQMVAVLSAGTVSVSLEVTTPSLCRQPPAATTAGLGVIGLAALLPVLLSPSVAVVPLKAGAVPTAVALGVTGT